MMDRNIKRVRNAKMNLPLVTISQSASLHIHAKEKRMALLLKSTRLFFEPFESSGRANVACTRT